MTEEQIENIDSENDAEEVETSEEETTEGQESDDGELTEREKQFLARAKKAESKLKELKTEDKPEPKKSNKDTWDYGQLAYLEMKGVKTDAEMEFVQTMMKRTGEELKSVLSDDYVKNRLKSIREEANTQQATPSNNRRTQTSGKDTVDYWINKGELPPTDQVELRRKVLNTKIEREKQKSKFSDNPIVGAGS